MIKLFLVASLVLAVSPVMAACSEQQLSDKAMEVATKLEALTSKNPKAAEAISTKMMTDQSNPKTMVDTNAMCKSYDETLADLAKAK